MKRLRRARRVAIVAGGLFCLVASTTEGAGFALLEQSVKGLGTAFAGTAASAEDASTVFFNPAGLTRLERTLADGRRDPQPMLQAAAHVVALSAEFDDKGSGLNPALGALGLPAGAGTLAGTSGGDGGVAGVVPNLYLHLPLGERLRLGVGVNAPFAFKTAYEDGWVGRYHALTSQIETQNYNPSLAFEVNDWLSLGVGLNAQRVDARLSNAVDQSTVCLSLAAAGAPIPCAALGLTTPGSVATDGNVDLRNARDWSFGWNAGLLLHPGESTRVGLHFRSKISHELEGTARFSNIDPTLAAVTSATPGVIGFATQRARAKVTLPESATVSLHHRLNERWAVMADVSWTRWTRFQRIIVNFADGSQLVQPEDWDNSVRYALGVAFTPDSRWTLRAGTAFDETPIPDAVRRTPRIPGEDRVWVAFGASYAFDRHWSVDAGYAHLFAVRDPAVRNTEVTTGHTLVGEFDSSADIASLQVVYRF